MTSGPLTKPCKTGKITRKPLRKNMFYELITIIPQSLAIGAFVLLAGWFVHWLYLGSLAAELALFISILLLRPLFVTDPLALLTLCITCVMISIALLHHLPLWAGTSYSITCISAISEAVSWTVFASHNPKDMALFRCNHTSHLTDIEQEQPNATN